MELRVLPFSRIYICNSIMNGHDKQNNSPLSSGSTESTKYYYHSPIEPLPRISRESSFTYEPKQHWVVREASRTHWQSPQQCEAFPVISVPAFSPFDIHPRIPPTNHCLHQPKLLLAQVGYLRPCDRFLRFCRSPRNPLYRFLKVFH
jgi:hypothetical protein